MRQKIKTNFHQIPEQFRNQDYRANYDVIGKYVVEGWNFYLLSYLQYVRTQIHKKFSA